MDAFEAVLASINRKRQAVQTEREWVSCDHPDPMLKFLTDRSTDRKFLLLVAACLRRLWAAPEVQPGHWAVVTLEAATDGKKTEEEAEAAGRALAEVRSAAICVLPESYRQANDFMERLASAGPGWLMANLTCDAMSVLAGRMAKRAMGKPDGLPDDQEKMPEESAQCYLIRDIFGNPFRSVTVDPAWLTSTVTAIACQMYDSRDFSPIPILADALQDAGCDIPEILDHFRGPGPHVRGCWAVDLVLGKE